MSWYILAQSASESHVNQVLIPGLNRRNKTHSDVHWEVINSHRDVMNSMCSSRSNLSMVHISRSNKYFLSDELDVRYSASKLHLQITYYLWSALESILGPTLFAIYINDLVNPSEK